MNKQAVSSGPRACTLRPDRFAMHVAVTVCLHLSGELLTVATMGVFQNPNWPIPPPPSCSQPPALLPQGSSGSYAPSANEQFFVGAQTVVSFLQTTQITSDVCLITDHVAYASTDKT